MGGNFQEFLEASSSGKMNLLNALEHATIAEIFTNIVFNPGFHRVVAVALVAGVLSTNTKTKINTKTSLFQLWSLGQVFEFVRVVRPYQGRWKNIPRVYL